MEKQKKNIENNIDYKVWIVVILINILPVILVNLGKKTSNAVPGIVTIIVYILQVFTLLLYFCKKRLKINKISKKYIIIWSIFTLILIAIQLYNYVFDTINVQDIMNILAKYITVILLIVLMFSANMEKSKINKVFKFIFYLGIIACIYNMILYSNEIMGLAKLQSSYSVNIKSFFANRNQYAQFLVIAAIASYFIIKEDNKMKYKIGLILILLNIMITMSRTAILAIGSFFIINFMENRNIKQNITYVLIGISVILITIFTIYKINPNVLNTFNRLFVRSDNLEGASGRTAIWKETVDVVDLNFLLGIGRFKGIDLLNLKALDFTQFHNIFLESYVSGGILEVMILIYLLLSLFINLIKNDRIDKYRKRIYIASLISFIIIGMFESCNRFSIGYVDTMFTIFFITLPILELNFKDIKNF